MGEPEFHRLAGWIDDALKRREEAASLMKIRAQVEELCRAFPLYVNRSL